MMSKVWIEVASQIVYGAGKLYYASLFAGCGDRADSLGS